MSQDHHKKVVIIEDDEDLLNLLVFAFESEGHEAVGILNGNDAIIYLNEKKNTQTICLLIIDRLLPDMDGLDILKQLPNDVKNHVPVLILSMLSSEKDILLGLKQGVVDYITKPFSLPIFMEKALLLIQKSSLK